MRWPVCAWPMLWMGTRGTMPSRLTTCRNVANSFLEYPVSNTRATDIPDVNVLQRQHFGFFSVIRATKYRTSRGYYDSSSSQSLKWYRFSILDFLPKDLQSALQEIRHELSDVVLDKGSSLFIWRRQSPWCLLVIETPKSTAWPWELDATSPAARDRVSWGEVARFTVRLFCTGIHTTCTVRIASTFRKTTVVREVTRQVVYRNQQYFCQSIQHYHEHDYSCEQQQEKPNSRQDIPSRRLKTHAWLL